MTLSIENYPALESLLEHVEELQDFLSSFLINTSEDGLSEAEISRLHVHLKVASWPDIAGCQSEKASWEQITREIKDYENERDEASSEAEKYWQQVRQQDLADYYASVM